jgi:hypothetical protein
MKKTALVVSVLWVMVWIACIGFGLTVVLEVNKIVLVPYAIGIASFLYCIHAIEERGEL